MTAIPSISFHDMESLQHDDTMDLASSPYQQADDLDFDLDPMREPSAEPNLESMFDENFDTPRAHSDTMEDEPTELHDDDMIDEDTIIHDPRNENYDINMEALPQNREHLGEDEDILYEEEEETADVSITIAEGKDAEVAEVSETSAANLKDVDQDILSEQEQNDETDHHIGSPTMQIFEKPGESHAQAEENDTITDEASGSSTEQAAPQASTDAIQDSENASADLESDAFPKDPSGQISNDNNNQGNEESQNPEQTSKTENDKADDRTALSTDAQNTTTAVNEMYLHPVKVIYQDSEICLFPPTHDDNSETFFLSDISLAFENLDKLLAACREVLAGTIGDDDELVLDVASLGLHICEVCSYPPR
jgi:hypothetical protein